MSPTTPSAGSITAAPRRRWYQYSLRSLFVLVTLVAIFFGWLSIERQHYERQAANLKELTKKWDRTNFEAKPARWAWLLSFFFPQDADKFVEVVELATGENSELDVVIGPVARNEVFDRLETCSHLRTLNVSVISTGEDNDVWPSLSIFPDLEVLYLNGLGDPNEHLVNQLSALRKLKRFHAYNYWGATRQTSREYVWANEKPQMAPDSSLPKWVPSNFVDLPELEQIDWEPGGGSLPVVLDRLPKLNHLIIRAHGADIDLRISDSPNFATLGLVCRRLAVSRANSLSKLHSLSIAVSDGQSGLPVLVDAMGENPSLEYLDYTGASDGDLLPLKKCNKLRALLLRHGYVTDEGLKPLERLASLREVEIGEGKLTGRGLHYLKNCGGLEELGIYGNRWTDDAISAIAELTSLERLAISSTMVRDVHHRHVIDGYAGVNFTQLSRLPNLRKLTLNDMPLTVESFAQIAALPRLEHLEIYGNDISGEIVSEKLRELAAASSLQTLVTSFDIEAESMNRVFPHATKTIQGDWRVRVWQLKSEPQKSN